MKKIIIICVLLLILFTLLGCQGDSTEELSLQVKKLQDEIKLLEIELKEVKRERDRLKAEIVEQEDNSNDVNKELLIIEVVDKINRPKDVDNWILDNSVNFHISITNNYKKDIREIRGELNIKTTAGVSILRFDCDLRGHIISSGETFTNKDTVFKINEYVNEDMRLYRTDHDDLKYTYKINEIIFTDGTTE